MTVKEYIITEELKQKMRKMRQEGMSCRQVANLLGIGKTTVSKYSMDLCIGKKRTKTHPIPPIKVHSKVRSGVLYNVKFYFIQGHRGLVIEKKLDHRPVYSDMMAICKEYGLPAVDFEDDRGTKIDDRIYHGTAYTNGSRAFYLARFTIERLRGDVYPEDFWR